MWSACVTRTSGAIVAIVDRHTLKNMPRSCLVSSIQSIRKRIIRRTCYNYISAVNYFSTIFVSGLEGVNPLRSHSHHPTVLRTPPTASFPPPPCHHAQSLRPATSPVTTPYHHALPPHPSPRPITTPCHLLPITTLCHRVPAGTSRNRFAAACTM